MIQDYFKLAFQNLRKRKLRSWLTILGIFIAVATIVILLSLSLGLEQAVEEQFRLIGTDKFFIQPRGQAGAPGAGGAISLTEKDVEEIEKVRGVKEVSYFIGENVKIEFKGQTRYYIIAAFPRDGLDIFEETTSIEVDRGKDLKFARRGDVALGSLYYSGNLFKRPIEPGDKIEINDQEVKVIAIMNPLGNPQDDQNIYMFLDTYEELFGKAERVDAIYVQIQPGEDIREVAERTEKELRDFRNVDERNQDFTVSTPEEFLDAFSQILDILTGFLIGIGAISLLVGGIGIANTMYTSVLERQKEIGTMKAVGARNKDILLVFLIEAGLLGLVGGILGILIGIVVGETIEIIATQAIGSDILRAVFPWYLILGALLFGFLIGSVSGLLPAKQASKLKPVDALRYE